MKKDEPIVEAFGLLPVGQHYSLVRTRTQGKKVVDQKRWDAEPKDSVYSRLRNEIVRHYVTTVKLGT